MKRIDAAEIAYENAVQKMHQLKEAGASSEERDAANLALQVSKEALIYARLDARTINGERKQNRKNLDQFTAHLPEIGDAVVFSDTDFNARLEEMAEREEILKAALENTKQELWSERIKKPEDQTQRKPLESLIQLLNEAVTYLPLERSSLEERRTLYAEHVPMKEVLEWSKNTGLVLGVIGELTRVKELRDTDDALTSPTDSLSINRKDKGEQAQQKEILLREKFAFDSLASLTELLQNHDADLQRTMNTRQVYFYKEKALSIFHSIWGLELAVIKDRPITIGKIILAITLFLIGMLIARFVITRLLLATLKKTGIRDGVAFTISHLLYYVTLAILLLVAISYAGIPFTIFAFFGGALAIAAGFGSQKILNNFLSGVILLLEGSIRVGDMVEVDQTQGRVKRIGLRHVQITIFANVDILVPNSKFLEENVIWMHLHSPIERIGVESDLRTAIIEVLGEQGIALASPTQDLILHRGRPES